MFRGAAWFSPTVPRYIRREWVTYGGKKAGRGRDRVRRRLWYCFCNGLQDPKLADVKSRGLLAYHALWIIDCVRQGQLLPMEDYLLDDNARPGLNVILPSPKSRPLPLALDSSPRPNTYVWEANDKGNGSLLLDPGHLDRDMSIDQDLDLEDLFNTPNRLQPHRDFDNSSLLSWDVTPSLTFDFDHDEEMEQSRVEMLLDAEGGLDLDGNRLNWSEMSLNPSRADHTPSDSIELNAGLVLAKLSERYENVLSNVARFEPSLEHRGKSFSAVKTRVSSAGLEQDTSFNSSF